MTLWGSELDLTDALAELPDKLPMSSDRLRLGCYPGTRGSHSATAADLEAHGTPAMNLEQKELKRRYQRAKTEVEEKYQYKQEPPALQTRVANHSPQPFSTNTGSSRTATPYVSPTIAQIWAEHKKFITNRGNDGRMWFTCQDCGVMYFDHATKERNKIPVLCSLELCPNCSIRGNSCSNLQTQGGDSKSLLNRSRVYQH